MSTNGITSDDLIAWIEKSLEGQNFDNYEINLIGKTEKGDGYIGDIVFAKVNGKTKEKEGKVLDLVIKHGKKNDHLRKSVPVRKAFEQEIHFYDKVFPVFKKLQLEKNVTNYFDSVPKCYKTLILDKMEVLVFHNLRTLGYELHDRKKPLNFDHLEVILKEYGKFHALSFALKQQKNEVFESIAHHNNNIFNDFMSEKSVRESFQRSTDDALNMLKEREDLVLFNKYKTLLVKSSSDMVVDLLNEKESQSVITHGDCWNNNFMFKYKSGDRTRPTKVAILDWQVSRVQSPALDLSYFIYTNTSKVELDRFNELMEIYYASFSQLLRELGSNPDELFTFSDLKRHWKKYSLYGLLLMPMLLRIALCDKEDAPALEDLREDEEAGDKLFIDIADKDVYYERLIGVISHYFEHVF